MKEKNKLGIKGIIGFVSWFFITQYSGELLGLMGINTSTIPKIFLEIYTVLSEVIAIFIIYKLFTKEIKKMWNDFYINKDEYFKKYFKYWFLIIFLMGASSALIMLVNSGSTPNNQDAINSMFKRFPLYTYMLTVFFAPVIEELVFRFCFKEIFSNKYLFIILSGCIFGSFHVLGSFETATDLLYIIPYSIPGIVFASIMYDSDNVFNSMWLHFVHNGMSMALTIIMLFI